MEGVWGRGVSVEGSGEECVWRGVVCMYLTTTNFADTFEVAYC